MQGACNRDRSWRPLLDRMRARTASASGTPRPRGPVAEQVAAQATGHPLREARNQRIVPVELTKHRPPPVLTPDRALPVQVLGA